MSANWAQAGFRCSHQSESKRSILAPSYTNHSTCASLSSGPFCAAHELPPCFGTPPWVRRTGALASRVLGEFGAIHSRCSRDAFSDQDTLSLIHRGLLHLSNCAMAPLLRSATKTVAGVSRPWAPTTFAPERFAMKKSSSIGPDFRSAQKVFSLG